MKKAPSSGFIYLVFVVLVTARFFIWVVPEGWYDRIRTPPQANKDLKKWAHYLERVAGDFEDESVREEMLSKAGSLYVKTGDKKNALGIYRGLIELAPDNSTYLSKLTALLYTEAKNQEEVVENVRKLYKNREENKCVDETMLKVLLALLIEGDEEISREEVLEMVFSGEYPRFCTFFEGGNIALCNLTPDRWSINVEPFFIAVKNVYDEEVQVRFEIGCWPDSRFVPVVAEIEGAGTWMKLVFDKENSFHKITLTVPPGETGLFKGNTNKTWRAPKDPRNLGVNVRFLGAAGAEAAEAGD